MPDSKKAVTKNRCGITGIKPATSMGPIKAVATTNRRRRISILTPSLIRANLPSIPDGTEGINGIPFQPSSTQAPPATAPPSAAFKGIKIVAPAAAKPSTTLAIRAHRGRGCCHRMSFTRPLYLKDSPSLGDVFAYQLSPEAATTQTKHLIRLHAGRSFCRQNYSEVQRLRECVRIKLSGACSARAGLRECSYAARCSGQRWTFDVSTHDARSAHVPILYKGRPL